MPRIRHFSCLSGFLSLLPHDPFNAYVPPQPLLLLHGRSSFHARGPATFSIFFPILSLAVVLLQQQPIDEWILYYNDETSLWFSVCFLFRNHAAHTRCSPTHAAVRAHRRFPIQRLFSLYSCSAFMCPNALLYVIPVHGKKTPNGIPVVAAITWRQGRRPLGTHVGRLRSNLSSSPSLEDGDRPTGTNLVSRN